MVMAAAVILISPCVHAQYADSRWSYYDGKKYEFNVSYDQLEATPTWTEEAENPPLAPRKAMATALSYLPKLVSNAEKWKFASLHLEPVVNKGKWIYIVKFVSPHPPGIVDGPVRTMDIIVLMNGKTVKPVISKHKLVGD